MDGEDPSEAKAGAGEDELIARLTAGWSASEHGDDVVVGVGDDCAVLASENSGRFELLKTDAVVAGVHFSETDDARLVGRKALCRAISDVAAMGGVPRAGLVTIALPGGFDLSIVESWYQGLQAAAKEFGVALVGGETTSTVCGDAMISVAMTGWVEKECCVLRSGAKVGDLIAVSGRLGGSLLSGRHLSFAPRLAAARWLVAEEGRRPTSMMDLSDGMAMDLPRLAKASAVGYRLDFEKIPCHDEVEISAALGDGEDYELLMTFSPERYPQSRDWQAAFAELELTVVGEITCETQTELQGGWDHLRDQ
jgi:thiamine-monophosphate kinase